MATHSSILTWRNLWTEEPGGLPSMGSHSQTRLKCLSSSSRNHLQKALSAISVPRSPSWQLHHSVTPASALSSRFL